MNKKCAFTLAEVLITLGIIGVVAALTIPTLIQKNQDLAFKTAAKKAYTNTAAAMLQLKQDEGGTLKEITSDKLYNYFKVMKYCGAYQGCLDSSKYYKNYNGDTSRSMDYAQMYTTDGMFYASTSSTIGYDQSFFIYVDVNGPGKQPNTLGKDVFVFQLIGDEFGPARRIGTSYNNLRAYCAKGGSSSYDSFNGATCTSYVLLNEDYSNY